MTLFLMVTARAYGFFLALPEDTAARMVRSSKKLRDADFLARSRYYTVEELADPDHPYRRLYARFEPELQRVPVY